MKTLYLFLICVLLIGCSKENSQNQDLESEWAVNENNITGQLSLFPLALNPEFTSINDVNLSDNELVGVVLLDNEVRVYPYTFVNQNEIINDELNGQKFAFSYCPITKSSVAFKREYIFRASGYLYKDNLTPWDEVTESIWSQMLIMGIRGQNKNKRFNTLPVLETNLGFVREYLPNARIMVNQSYKNSKAPDPDNNGDDNENAPQSNQRAYGILDNFNDIFIFKYEDFSNSNIINISIQSQDYIVYGNVTKRVINAFKVPNNQVYVALENEFPFIIKNNNGVKYDILGRGTNGTTLEKPQYAYVAIWKAWDDFYDNFTFQ